MLVVIFLGHFDFRVLVARGAEGCLWLDIIPMLLLFTYTEYPPRWIPVYGCFVGSVPWWIVEDDASMRT